MHSSQNEFGDTYVQPPSKQITQQHVKSQTKWKYPVLLLSIWIIIPSFYCFDQPVALFPILESYFSDTNSLNFEIYFAALYIIYALGNALLPLFTGGMRDCNGDKKIMTFIAIIMILGQLLFTLGVYLKSFIFMILGRVILGWGVESILPLQASFLAPFFKSDISIVLAILQLCSQTGLVSAIYVTPYIVKQYGLYICLLSGVVFLLIGFGLLMISFYIDEQLEENNYISSYRIGNTCSEIILQDDQNQTSKFYWFKFKDFKIYPYMFWLLLAFNSLCINYKLCEVYCSIVTLVNVSMYVMASILFKIDNEFQLLDIALFWMLGCLSLFVIGPFVNYFGNRRFMILASVFIIMFGHVQYVTTPHLGLTLLAIGYCFAFVSTWSAIIYIIKLSAFGKAFGITVCFQNLIFVFMPFILDAVNKRFLGTFQVLFLMCTLALVVGIKILIEDMRLQNILDCQIVPIQLRIRNLEEDTQDQNDLFAQYLRD